MDMEKTDPRFLKIIEELKQWPGVVLTSHKSGGHPIHKLVFLAESGFDLSDPGIREIADRVMEHKSEEGVFQVLMNIPVHFGGTGEDQYAWAACDAPLIMYALARFGVDYEKHLKRGIDYLFSLCRENGWPCACSKELGKFRGPGRKEDSCPYVNLIMLKLASVLPDYAECKSTRAGAEALLENWAGCRAVHPYMFFMGTDFRKLKAPFIWYDILHVAEMLGRFEFVRRDVRYQDMVAVLREKPKSENGYVPESIWKAWSDWDFGQKKNPSPYITEWVEKILSRV